MSAIFKPDACRLTLEDLKDWINRLRELKPLSVWVWYGGETLSEDDGEELARQLPPPLVKELIDRHFPSWSPEWLALEKGFQIEYRCGAGMVHDVRLPDGRHLWWATVGSPFIIWPVLEELDKLASEGWNLRATSPGVFLAILLEEKKQPWAYLEDLGREAIALLRRLRETREPQGPAGPQGGWAFSGPAEVTTPQSPVELDGFLGGLALADALGVHPQRRDAFFKRLERERLSIGDENWKEITDKRPNEPRFLYRVSAVRKLASEYREPPTSH